MPWNGTGTYVLPPAYSPEVNGTIIDATRYNGLTTDVATGISFAIAKDGQNVPVGNLPMGGFKHTGAADANAAGQYVVFGQATAITTLSIDTLTVNTALLSNGATTIGNASGDAFTITSSTVTLPNGLNFDANTLVIDAANNRVGIRTATPSTAFHVVNGTGEVLFSDNGDGLVLNSATTAQSLGLSAGGNYGVAQNAAIKLTPGASANISFITNSGSRLNIDATGQITPGTNNTQSLGSSALNWSNTFSSIYSIGSLAALATTGNVLRVGNAAWTAMTLYGGTTPAVDITSTTVSPASNNAFSNGTSSFRWSNVFSVLGNFTGSINSDGTFNSGRVGSAFTQSSSNSGAANEIRIENTANTAGSDTRFYALTAGASAGDPYIRMDISGIQGWVFGIDNSDSDAFVFSAGTALGTANALRISTAGAVSIPLGDLALSRAQAGGNVDFTLENTSNTATSNARAIINVAGASANDPFTLYQVSGVTSWAVGIDNSVANDPFVIAASGALGTTNVMSITTSGIVTIPGTLGVTTDFSVSGNVQLGTTSANTVTVSGNPGGRIEGNSYVSAVTLVENVAAATVDQAYYMRIGAFVHVVVQVNIDPTSASVQTRIGLSLPLVSALANSYEVVGGGARIDGGNVTASVTADTANDRAEVRFLNDASIVSSVWKIWFVMRIV